MHKKPVLITSDNIVLELIEVKPLTYEILNGISKRVDISIGQLLDECFEQYKNIVISRTSDL